MSVILNEMQSVKDSFNLLSKAMEEQQAYMINSFWKDTINYPTSRSKEIEAPGTYMLGMNNVYEGLKAAKVENKKYLYVSRVSKEYSFYDVLLYIARKLNIDKTNFYSKIQCYPLYNVGDGMDDINFLSFKICLNESDYKTVCDPNFWPTGILFRQFVDLPRRFCQRWRARPLNRLGQTTESSGHLNASVRDVKLNEVVPQPQLDHHQFSAPVPPFREGNFFDPLNFPLNDF